MRFFIRFLSTIVIVIVNLIVFVGSIKTLHWAEKSNHSIAKKCSLSMDFFSHPSSLSHLRFSHMMQLWYCKNSAFSFESKYLFDFIFFAFEAFGESTLVYVPALIFFRSLFYFGCSTIISVVHWVSYTNGFQTQSLNN